MIITLLYLHVDRLLDKCFSVELPIDQIHFTVRHTFYSEATGMTVLAATCISIVLFHLKIRTPCTFLETQPYVQGGATSIFRYPPEEGVSYETFGSCSW